MGSLDSGLLNSIKLESNASSNGRANRMANRVDERIETVAIGPRIVSELQLMAASKEFQAGSTSRVQPTNAI